MLEREVQGETAGTVDDHLHAPGFPPHELLGEAGDILADHAANRGVRGRLVGQRHAQQDPLILIATDTSPPVPDLVVEGDVADDLRVAGRQGVQDGGRTVGGGGETGEIAGIARDAPPAIEHLHGLMDLRPGIRRARRLEPQGLGRQIGAGPDGGISAAVVALHLAEAGIGKVGWHDTAGGHEVLAHPEIVARRAVEEGLGALTRREVPGPRGLVLGCQRAALGRVGQARRAGEGGTGRGLVGARNADQEETGGDQKGADS